MPKNKDKAPKNEKPMEPENEAAKSTEAEDGSTTLSAEEMAEVKKLYDTVNEQQTKIAESQDQYLRLCAEYDNYRKRSQREKEALYSDIKAQTVSELLPVYDNLERALKQPCADEAYAKGVQMTMTQFEEILKKLGVEEIEALGKPFDPNMHNGVMHEENEAFGENEVSEVFQKGFKIGEKVIRFALVKVAN